VHGLPLCLRGPPPHVCSTFGGLALVGAKAALNGTVRTAAWIPLTAGLSAALREYMRSGPRFHDGLAAFGWDYHVLNALAGVLVGEVVRVGSPPRPTPLLLAYIGLTGAAGNALPLAIALASPVIRKQLQLWQSERDGGRIQ
jgi:hypothetical protein